MRCEWFSRESRWAKFGYRRRREEYGKGDGKPVGPKLVSRRKRPRHEEDVDPAFLFVSFMVAVPFIILLMVLFLGRI